MVPNVETRARRPRLGLVLLLAGLCACGEPTPTRGLVIVCANCTIRSTDSLIVRS